MRIGTSRLVRDHLHLLAKQASCDLICQAHGDDLSHSLRSSLLVKAFNDESRNASMIFVNALVIDRHGKTLLEPKNLSLSTIPMTPVGYNAIIDATNELLIGSNMAWRKSAFNNFPQLTTAYCTYGHDRVMTFRSFLIGGCYLMDAPLLKRRIHNNNLHKELVSFDNKSINSFNTQLIRLCLFSTMKNDLIFLKENNLIDETNFDQHTGEINDVMLRATGYLTRATSELVNDGYVNTWAR
jgi:hypothetical protein